MHSNISQPRSITKSGNILISKEKRESQNEVQFILIELKSRFDLSNQN